jgi:hypothetical protein
LEEIGEGSIKVAAEDETSKTQVDSEKALAENAKPPSVATREVPAVDILPCSARYCRLNIANA